MHVLLRSSAAAHAVPVVLVFPDVNMWNAAPVAVPALDYNNKTEPDLVFTSLRDPQHHPRFIRGRRFPTH
ncbi:MAG: hypothetical protein SGI92_25500, partial [Bryobacteraceae bacterium]|nr:hypothetical protein [Bryobacteraceae bacterium]